MMERSEAESFRAAAAESGSDFSQEVVERSRELEPELLAIWQDLHENPELGGQEVRTSQKVQDRLNQLGIEILANDIGLERKDSEHIENNSVGTGVVAIIRGDPEGPTVALRADMDALPIAEPDDHSPRSQTPGVMHACGHDAHTTGLLGGGQILKELADKGNLPGNVILMFQPSEEKAHQKESGAVQMVKFLERHQLADGQSLRDSIDAFYGMHVVREPRGTINVKEGVQMASSGELDIVLRTKGGHIMDAYKLPNLNRINAEITVRLHDTFQPLSEQGKVHVASRGPVMGGQGYNVLPPSAESTWAVRVPSEQYKQISAETVEQIRNIIEEVVTKYEVKGDPEREVEVELRRRPGYRPVIHRNKELVEIAEQSANQVIAGAKNLSQTVMGGEDMSFYLEKLNGRAIPGVFMFIGAANPQKGIPPGSFHSSDFRIDPEVIKDLAGLHANFSLNALNYLREHKQG